MTKTIYTILIALCINIVWCQTNCHELNPSIWSQSWVSCQMAPNPNASRPSSHWIQYDFGTIRHLSSMHVWNHNQSTSLRQGVKNVIIDYSADGSIWQQLGTYQWPKATGTSDYPGFQGPDFGNVQARYVLITVLSNWGDPSCNALTEVMFNLGEGLEENETQPIAPPTLFSLEITELGDGVGDLLKSPDRILYSKDSEVTITAIPKGGSNFEGWSGDLISGNAQITIKMDAHKSMTATFSNGGNICNDDELTLVGDLSNQFFRAKVSIKSSGSIAGGDVSFQAGQGIELMPGFTTQPGIQFVATIADCNK